MIDFHTHILPNIDDGSQSMEASLTMLRKELQQGVRQIVFTPHFYADQMTIETFLQRRLESTQRLARALTEEAGISWTVGMAQAGETAGTAESADPAQLHFQAGAEVYFFPGIGRAEKLPLLCIQGTDLVLVEMPFTQWDRQVLRELEEILTKQKLRVILAHVERYPDFQRDRSVWDQVLQMTERYPLTLQVNGGGFLRGRSRRKFCLRLLEEQKKVVLGSDCHNTTSRVPNLEDARAIIRKKLGEDRLARIDALGQQVLYGSV